MAEPCVIVRYAPRRAPHVRRWRSRIGLLTVVVIAYGLLILAMKGCT